MLGAVGGKFPCACCDSIVRSEKEFGTFEICPVCGWEDDDVQASDPNFFGGANSVSLNDAQANFAQYGRSDPSQNC